MSKPKLLYVIADSSQTGAPSQVLFLARSLALDYEVSLLCPEGWLAKEAERSGTSVYCFPETASRFEIRKYIGNVYQKVSPRIIHCHGVRGGLLARMVQTPVSAKMVYTEHLWTNNFHLSSKLRERLQIFLLRTAARKTDRVVAVSKAVEKFLVDKKITTKSKISLIYGGVDLSEPSEPVSDPVVGTIGRLNAVKGVSVLIKSLGGVRSQIPNVKCRIAGDGPEAENLRILAEKQGVTANIEWMGAVDNAEEFYKTLRLYIQPSLSESFGMAPLEAMSAGIPVIVSDSGALPEIVRDGVDGLVFKSKDDIDLAQKIIQLLSNSEMRGKMREGAIRRAADFSIAQMAEKHRTMYEELLS